MQIYGIGTDLVSINRIARLYLRYGARFTNKLLSSAERASLPSNPQLIPAFLAKRFAAKEAVAKALGTGFREQVQLQGIAITTDSLGKPEVNYLGETLDFVTKQGITDTKLSLSDERDYALAFVVLSS